MKVLTQKKKLDKHASPLWSLSLSLRRRFPKAMPLVTLDYGEPYLSNRRSGNLLRGLTLSKAKLKS